ncbi:hypothetical protein [Microtetraspora niveoalba]|uniref:hypothetical protein n=1 Tax=Microtetraspora niveoalba TaxID=46175 RepID=UPI00082CA22C|nr:hypothetical protein [Microtetraspora niveoalba]
MIGMRSSRVLAAFAATAAILAAGVVSASPAAAAGCAIAPQAPGGKTLRNKSTIVFNSSPEGTRRSTGRVWVPNGGQVGVYGQNTNRWGTAHLDFAVIRAGSGSREVTCQFWPAYGPTGEYSLHDGQIVNRRAVNRTGGGNYYYIIATCDIRTTGDCDGSFTISSWY